MPWWAILACCAVCAAGGLWGGVYLAGRFALEKAATEGVFVFRGVRYRVERIGRKPKD